MGLYRGFMSIFGAMRKVLLLGRFLEVESVRLFDSER